MKGTWKKKEWLNSVKYFATFSRMTQDRPKFWTFSASKLYDYTMYGIH